MNIEANQKVGVKGHFDIYLTRGETGVKELVSSFDNLILDQGMDRIGSGGAMLAHCHIGTGNSTPTVTQTTLDTKIATQPNGNCTIASPTAPNYVQIVTNVYSFAQGAVVANLSEVGVGFTTTQLFCRALTVDGAGNPTTITVTAIDYLTIVYTLSIFPNLADTTDTVVINGVSTTVTTRAIDVLSPVGYPPFFYLNGYFMSGFAAGYGALRPVTSTYGYELISGYSGYSAITYVAGSFKAKWVFTFDNDRGNGTITRFELKTSLGGLQMGVSPPIVKNNTMTLTVTAFITWARA